MTKTLTAETITDKQIRQLRDEAGTAGDLDMVKICDRALTWEDEYRTALQYDSAGHRNRAAAWEDVRRAEACRARCAEVINDASARMDT